MRRAAELGAAALDLVVVGMVGATAVVALAGGPRDAVRPPKSGTEATNAATPCPVCYGLAMRSANLFSLILFTACGDDATTTDKTPDPYSVEVFDSCRYYDELGGYLPNLCKVGLLCSDAGICMPPCDTTMPPLDEEGLCPKFEGFESRCDWQSSTIGHDICIIACNKARECPETPGEPLKCSPGHLDWCT